MKASSSIILSVLLATAANAATVSVSTTAPTVDGLDEANLVTSTGSHKWFSDVEHDAGQTFTPSADAMLTAFTIQMNFGSANGGVGDTGQNPNDNGIENLNLRLVSPPTSPATSPYTDIYLENAALLPAPGGNWAPGDYVTFTFDTPQALTGGTEYGVITDAQNFGTWQNGIAYMSRGDGYAGGNLIGRGSASTNGSDLVFHANLVASQIPEPSRAVLLILGVFGLLVRRRR